jgi:hypothetical protein
MKIILALVASLSLSTVAFAQQECRSIQDSTARLACYDKAAPLAAVTPGATQQTAKPQAAAPKKSKVEAEKYVDTISAEDARMNTRLRTICRGC